MPLLVMRLKKEIPGGWPWEKEADETMAAIPEFGYGRRGRGGVLPLKLR